MPDHALHAKIIIKKERSDKKVYNVQSCKQYMSQRGNCHVPCWVAVVAGGLLSGSTDRLLSVPTREHLKFRKGQTDKRLTPATEFGQPLALKNISKHFLSKLWFKSVNY